MPEGPLVAGDLTLKLQRELNSLNQPTPPRLITLLSWMIAFDSEKRPWSADEVVSELESILEELLDQSSIKHFARKHVAECVPSSQAVIRNVLQGIEEHRIRQPQTPATQVPPDFRDLTDVSSAPTAYPSIGLVARMVGTGEFDPNHRMVANAAAKRPESHNEETEAPSAKESKSPAELSPTISAASEYARQPEAGSSLRSDDFKATERTQLKTPASGNIGVVKWIFTLLILILVFVILLLVMTGR